MDLTLLLHKAGRSAHLAIASAVCAIGVPTAIATTITGISRHAADQQASSVSTAGYTVSPSHTTMPTGYPSGGFTPQAIRQVYNVSPLLKHGIDGSGETVVLPETTSGAVSEGGNTNIRQDLVAFDKRYRLPRAELQIIKALGFDGTPVAATSEEVQDVEAVHTIAPGATIRIMMVPLKNFALASGLGAGLRTAAERGDVVSLSDSVSEAGFTGVRLKALNSALSYARMHHVTVLASAGDGGVNVGSPTRHGRRGADAPGTSPLVTDVGGTTLRASTDGMDATETVWDDDTPKAKGGAMFSATGGGLSSIYARPSFQAGLRGLDGRRGVPDVSAVAEPGIASVLVSNGHSSTFAAGGTSESAPLWAGIVALADQAAHRRLGWINPALYRIGHSSNYRRAFHDVTQGDNSVQVESGQTVKGYSARAGWDLVSGWGTPDANVLVPLLGEVADTAANSSSSAPRRYESSGVPQNEREQSRQFHWFDARVGPPKSRNLAVGAETARSATVTSPSLEHAATASGSGLRP